MKKSINKRDHGKTIIMHLKRHHRKYFCGIFGGFALVKMALLFFGLNPVLNIGNIFANEITEGILLNHDNLNTTCDVDETSEPYIINCVGKNIGHIDSQTFQNYSNYDLDINLSKNVISVIDTGTFSGLKIINLNLSNNKLSVFDFGVLEGARIENLDLNYNQIFNVLNNHITDNIRLGTLNLENNCLPGSVILGLPGDETLYINYSNQKSCFYIEYNPNTFINKPVDATLQLTGNEDITSNLYGTLGNEGISKTFQTNGYKHFDVSSLIEKSGDINNYPENSSITAYVDWIDVDKPVCGNDWTYTESNTSNRIDTVVTASLTGSTDDIGIMEGWGSCTIGNGQGSTCSVKIKDIAGNITECISDRSYNVDTMKPSISLNKNSGNAATEHNVTVTIRDDGAGLIANQKLKYKWTKTELSCGTNGFSEISLPAGNNVAVTVSTEGLTDGEYYLCILEGTISDNVGNHNVGLKSSGRFIVNNLNNSKPSCSWGEPTMPSLKVGKTGMITLNCTDTEGIETNSLNAGDIEYDGNIISLRNNATIGNIDNGISYTFRYTALSSGNTSLLLKTGRIENNVGNTNDSTKSHSIYVSETGHPSAENFVEFPVQLLDGRTKSDNLRIEWLNGATGGYDYFDDNNINTKNRANIPYIIPSSFDDILMLSFDNYLHNNKYICAFGQLPGYEPQTICSDHKIQIDYENPEITITSPANNSNLVLGSDAILQWSGNDYGYSGISGYILSINKPSGPLNSIALGADTSQRTITLDETGTWSRSITIRDHALNSGVANRSFRVVTSNEPPVVNGDLGNLVEFPVQLLDGWARSDSLRIERLNGATGGYDYFDDNDISTKDWTNIPYIIPSSFNNILKLSFNNYLYNNKYVCAFGQLPGYEPQTICSDHKIQIDYEDPEITIVSPSNYDNFLLGSGITLKWSGADYGPSDISGYILKITKPSGPLNPIVLPANTTQRNVTLNETGTWRRSVTIKDHAQNSGIANGTFYVIASNEPPVINGNLIEFAIEVSPTWVQQDVVRLELYQGADGGYAYFNTNDIGVIDWSGGYDPIPTSGFINLSSSNNGEYICAFGSKWGATQSVCSEHPIKIDNTNPHILLEYPSDGSDFKKGADIRLNWSGWDIQSGISGYTLKITDPSGENISYDFGANTIEKIITLDDAGTRYRSVVAYDKTDHSTTSYTGFFYVSDDGIIPENGFYLISPALGDKIRLGEDVILSWHHGATNNGYEWEVKNISGTRVSYGTTGLSTVAIDDSYFTTGGYSWSVKDIASDTTKTIPLFYIVDGLNIPDLMVRQFEFNEIDDADLDEYYQSDIITVKGLEDGWYTLAYLGSGKGALYINDKFVGVTGFVQNGDKVYVEMKASDEYNTTVKTTLYIGVGDDVVSGDYKITTKDGIHSRDDPSLTPMQKLWGIIYIDSLIEMYQYDHEKLAIFLSTFMQLLQDKSDYYAKLIQEAEEDGDEELVKEYKLYKEAIDFLYITVKYRYDNLEVEDRTVYIAPNGKQYLVEFDESRMAYTSPDFARPKYFPTWELFKNHIDLNNPAVGKWGIVGNVITTHNGKVYTIYETNGKWTSSNFKTAKYFDTKEDIINHILANNPASNWNHTIDTNFEEVKYTAPNGKVYKIFRTSSKGNNPEMYSSYDFVNAKYFTSLEAAKKFIDQNNPKK